MSALPDGPFTDRKACVAYAEEELLGVCLDMQNDTSVAGPADTSEYFKHISPYVVDPSPRIQHPIAPTAPSRAFPYLYTRKPFTVGTDLWRDEERLQEVP